MTTNLDAVLQQALAFHQGGKLAEAEQLYRQVLAGRPLFAEVHVQLGIALMFRGRLAEAEASCRQGVALKPDYARGHHHLADVFAHQKRFEEAQTSYRQAIALKRDYADAHNNLGNVLAELGKREESEASYRRAIGLKADLAQAHNNLGNLLMQQDRSDEALECYRRAVAARPDMAPAHNAVGQILMQQQKFDEAVASFRKAVAARPAYAEALCNLAAALGQQDKFEEAAAACQQAIAAKPDYAGAYHNLGNVRKHQGQLAEAEENYRKAIALKSDFAEAHKQLGLVLCEQDRIAEGFGALTTHAELLYGLGQVLRPGPEVAHKIRHDREQHAYLTGDAPREGEAVVDGLLLADGGRVAGSAVNLNNSIAELEEQWRTRHPQIVVIDNLLTEEALEKLRRFCLGSKIWRVIYEGGYLGAMPEHGFGAPLLAQIADELRTAYPAIFAGHPLRHSWAFKYDSSLSGIQVHADFAAVNVNFWITPDEANLDPESGGLVVWDKAAPLDWDFEKYNTAEKEIHAYLESQNAKSVTIPYRANRAVIFDSDLFHETDKIAFKEGYLNRRINVTLLYGDRQTAKT